MNNKELLEKITNEEFHDELIRRINSGEIWIGTKDLKVEYGIKRIINTEVVDCLGFKFGVRENGNFHKWKFLDLLGIKKPKEPQDEIEKKLEENIDEFKEESSLGDFLRELVSKTERGLINLKYEEGCMSDDEPSSAYLDYHYLETKWGDILRLTTLKDKSKNYE